MCAATELAICGEEVGYASPFQKVGGQLPPSPIQPPLCHIQKTMHNGLAYVTVILQVLHDCSKSSINLANIYLNAKTA